MSKNLSKPTSKNSFSKTFQVGRDAKTGLFVSVKEAKRHPNTTVVETIKIPRKSLSGQFISLKPATKPASITSAQADRAVRSYLNSSKKK